MDKMFVKASSVAYQIRCIHPEQPRAIEDIIYRALQEQDAETEKRIREEIARYEGAKCNG